MKNKTMNELIRLSYNVKNYADLGGCYSPQHLPPSAKFFILLSLTQQLSTLFVQRYVI